MKVSWLEKKLESDGYTLTSDDVLPGGEGTRIYEVVKGKEKIEVAISISKAETGS